ncbi:MAG: Maf family nucleotide pyrophosphatase [Bacteroidota bacterium]|nr:Maf family nucleotide pyrophosphatase [Bacteroidota bacterium]
MEQTAPLILASGSPRRQALLMELGLKFRVVTKEIDEDFPGHLVREEVALFLARKKASMYDNEIKEGNIVITADTIVCVDDKILNKPAAYQEAFNMLQLLSGRSHEVITAVCISGEGISSCFHLTTTVIFKKLSVAEINYYIEKHQPYDKAGGYGIQEWIGLIGMDRMEGSYYNVVGLPVKELYEELIALNVLKGL